jgi:hypothetical protein
VSALPLLVEWGNVISKLVVGGLAVGAVLGYRALRNHRDVKAARADAGRMSLSVDEPREGPIAVAGTYRAKGDERWLDCSGQRVVLVGELAIVRGSSATWKTGTRTYALRDGDGVVAIGVMSRRAGDNVTDYRESAGGWQLAASPGELGVQVCLVKPVPCPKPLWPIRGVLVLGVVGVAAYYGLGVVGKKLVESRKYPREAFLDGDGVSTLAAQIACALPRHRDMALDRYAIDLDYKPQTTEVIEQQIAIASLRGCWGGVRELEDRSRYEQAVEAANECGHPEYGLQALVALGRYEEAAKFTKDDDRGFSSSIIALIGAGHWSEVAAHVEGAKYRDAEGARCFARYLKSLATDVPPELGELGQSKTCRIIAGVFDDRTDEYDSAVSTARWAFAGGPNSGYTNLAQWLSPYATFESYGTHAARAHLAMDKGDFDLAQVEIDKAAALIAPETSEEELALRTGNPIESFELHPRYSGAEEEAALLRSGAHPADLPKLGDNHADVILAFVAAKNGDGLPLAQLHERVNERGGLGLRDEYLLAIAPSVKAHREELARAIRNRPRSGIDPTDLVHELAIERDLLRLLGDTKGAERWQAIIDRHAKALGDREKLKALLLLDSFY